MKKQKLKLAKSIVHALQNDYAALDAPTTGEDIGFDSGEVVHVSSNALRATIVRSRAIEMIDEWFAVKLEAEGLRYAGTRDD
jgi:hypothetical protein